MTAVLFAPMVCQPWTAVVYIETILLTAGCSLQRLPQKIFDHVRFRAKGWWEDLFLQDKSYGYVRVSRVPLVGLRVTIGSWRVLYSVTTRCCVIVIVTVVAGAGVGRLCV